MIRTPAMRIVKPRWDLDKIKLATDEPTFERAVGLYEGGKVTRFRAEMSGFFAVVIGSQPYEVFVSARRYNEGSCSCYLGQKETLCKHMVALAIRAVTGGKPLTDDDKQQRNQVRCGGRVGTLTTEELAAVKKSITAAMRYIKPYDGPSRIWFAYQNSLTEGSNRLSAIVSDLPASPQTAKLVVQMLLRLDDKLCHSGVDDSDGTVGGFIENAVTVLKEFARLDPTCTEAFRLLQGQETCFDWEKPLLQLIA